jgi:CubicO group peptidase (beta-lactamase class C family)
MKSLFLLVTLVSGDWLSAHLHDPSLVILHVGQSQDYNAGHIPGARLVSLSDISITGERGLRLELPPVPALVQTFGRLGVSDTSRIVVYAGTESVQSATRVWFTLDYLGLGDRAALLDGGLAAWRAAQRTLTSEAPTVQPHSFMPHPAPQKVVNAEWVRGHLSDKAVQVLDARLPEFYSGENAGGMPRAGHIPGARNVPYNSLLGENGTLKPAGTLHSSLDGAPSMVSYCHIGQQATVLYFAARYVGLDAHLYDGSFQDWSARPELPVDSSAPAAGKLAALFAPLANDSSPGLAVLVQRHGVPIFQRGFGVRDLRTKTPIDAHTDFRLASFTKQFTATAVMLLVHDGKLRYDQKLTEIFPDFPAYGRAITIRHLLTHTAGLPEYEELMGNGPWTAEHQIQDDEALDLLKRQTAGKFAPGTSWAYSNSAYVVLGLVVAKASGMPFAQFLHDRIFQPLHMDDTLVFVNGRNTVPNRAYGHNKRGADFVEADQSSTSATQGDGGVYSNLADLSKWDAALESRTLLDIAPALSPVKLAGGADPKWPLAADDDNLAPGKPVAYGFGWFLDPYQGRARMWHSGSTSGFRTVIDRFTADGLTIVILSNRTDLDPTKLALQAAGIVSSL